MKKNETTYTRKNKRNYSSAGRKLKEINGDNEVFGMCPVASEKTVCCNLKTIDVAQGCGLGCSYCSIQTFYENGSIAVEKNLADKLAAIDLDPNKNYHIGSGQSSDSLSLGNKNGILDAQRTDLPIFCPARKKIDFMLQELLWMFVFGFYDKYEAVSDHETSSYVTPKASEVDVDVLYNFPSPHPVISGLIFERYGAGCTQYYPDGTKKKNMHAPKS